MGGVARGVDGVVVRVEVGFFKVIEGDGDEGCVGWG